MIHTVYRADIVTVKDNLALEFIPILPYLVMLYHNDHQVYIVQERIEIEKLILNNPLVDKRVINFERARQITLLGFEQLQGRRLADIIHILLVCQAIKPHLAVIGNTFLLHDFVDAVKHERRLAIVRLHRLINHLGKRRIKFYLFRL